jgi:2-oxo-4-hydroxy-4-carboxy-5-ureidoimidazoline decarboxylase
MRNPGLDRLNALPAEQARGELLACCSAERWVSDVGSGRPYPSVDDLLARSDASVAGLAQADLEQALAGHPRIGDPVAGGAASGRSHQEQAGVHTAASATIQGLAEGNEAYERRFGHIYLVCASGRSGAELLDLLTVRLANDPGTEWGVVRGELGKINRIRLLKLLEDPAEARP